MKIHELILPSGNFEAQKSFYQTVLELPLLEAGENRIRFQAGESVLTFKRAESSGYYHFAFNIYSNQIEQALDWLEAKMPVLKNGFWKIQDFLRWHARAVYFYDKDKNIVEFIARKNLNIEDDNIFSQKSILNISEAGLPCDDVKAAFEIFQKQAGLEKYSGNMHRFCAAGDKEGLVILVNQNIKNWFPTDLPAKPFPYECHFSEQGKSFLLKVEETNITLQLTEPD